MPDNDSQLPSKKPHRSQKKVDSPKSKVPFASEKDLWYFEENQDSINLESTRKPLPNANSEPTLRIIEEEIVGEVTKVEGTKPNMSPIVNSLIQSAALGKFKELAELSEKNVAANIIKQNTESEIWEDFLDNDALPEVVIPENTKVREDAQIQIAIDDKPQQQAPPGEREPEEVVAEPSPPIQIDENVAANSNKQNSESEIWEDFLDNDELPEVVIPEKTQTAKITHVADRIDDEPEAQASPQVSVQSTVIVETVPPIEIDEFAPMPSTGESTPLQITKFSRLEKITSLAFLALFLIGSFFAYKAFHDNIKAEVNVYATPSFPVKGKLVKINEAKTYWRLPVREGPNPDPIKLNVILIPVIEITLDDSSKTKGAIRVIFRNGAKIIVGDSLTKTFADHLFTANQSATLTFACTDGFTDYGEQEAYRAQLSKPWSIEVYEGAEDNAALESFNLLFTTPISIIRQ